MNMKMSQKRHSKKKDKTPRSLQLISKTAPFQYVEAYKSLRTNLNFMAVGNEYRKIVVTSAIPGEGKSNVAVNLSVSLAETGKTVLLVDCDLRKPVMHKYLRLGSKANGLTSVLSGTVELNDAIVRFTDLGIHVLAAGPIPPNPAELLGSKAMEMLLNVMQQRYDYIIFDTPPVSVVTDAAVLGRITDGAILVVRQNFAKIESAQLAKKNLENVGVNIIGAVLNGYDMKSSSKDSGYYYSYEYEYSKSGSTTE